MQLSELQVTAATHLEEREFYFSKLRDIEVLCQMDEIKGQAVINCPCHTVRHTIPAYYLHPLAAADVGRQPYFGQAKIHDNHMPVIVFVIHRNTALALTLLDYLQITPVKSLCTERF